LTLWTVGPTWLGCSCPCNRIITRRTLGARSRAAEPLWHRPCKRFRLLSMTLQLPSRRTLRRSVIHFLEIRRLLGVALPQVVRTWRKTEEAAESSFGRGEHYSVVQHHMASATGQCQRTSLSSPRANFSFPSPFHTSFFDPVSKHMHLRPSSIRPIQ